MSLVINTVSGMPISQQFSTMNDVDVLIDNQIKEEAKRYGVILSNVTEWENQFNRGVFNGRDAATAAHRDGIIEFFRDVEGNYDWKTRANQMLDHFGYENIATKFRVSVVDTTTGDEIFQIIVDADDEDDACEKVEADVSPSDACLTLSWEYSGDGEVEDQSDVEDENDQYFIDHYLSFEAEPYDE